jgi:hypothetical protein
MMLLHMQGFNWELWKKQGGWYNYLRGRVDDIAATAATHVWLPSPSHSVASQECWWKSGPSVDSDTTDPFFLSLRSLPRRILLPLALRRKMRKLNNTRKNATGHLADQRPKELRLSSVLSSYYSVSVPLQGVHYL